ncbi:arylamine N-acetyltransferase, partial [Nonomuraea sp. RK-328]|nr:arylamine N-acetyltransferase [Nonomuraea sp. RK-328]
MTWDIEKLDLDAYLTRIGRGAPRTPSAETLRSLHRAHVTSIPFENLDVVLGRGARIDLESLQHKLVGRRRGGYCHEHNLLFAAALERLGFRVTRHLARIRLGRLHLPRTH